MLRSYRIRSRGERPLPRHFCKHVQAENYQLIPHAKACMPDRQTIVYPAYFTQPGVTYE